MSKTKEKALEAWAQNLPQRVGAMEPKFPEGWYSIRVRAPVVGHPDLVWASALVPGGRTCLIPGREFTLLDSFLLVLSDCGDADLISSTPFGGRSASYTLLYGAVEKDQ